MAIMSDTWFWPMIAAIDTASRSDGTESMMSTMRMMSVSTQPPNMPHRKPSSMPPVRPIAVDTTPMMSVARAPQISFDSTSPPKRSSPSGNPGTSPIPGMCVGVM